MQSRNTSTASTGSSGLAANMAEGAYGGSKTPARWDATKANRSTIAPASIGAEARIEAAASTTRPSLYPRSAIPANAASKRANASSTEYEDRASAESRMAFSGGRRR